MQRLTAATGLRTSGVYSPTPVGLLRVNTLGGYSAALGAVQQTKTTYASTAISENFNGAVSPRGSPPPGLLVHPGTGRSGRMAATELLRSAAADQRTRKRERQ